MTEMSALFERDTMETRAAIAREGRATRQHIDERLQTLKVDEEADLRAQVLSELRPPESCSRRDDIKETHADTFEWIFAEELEAGEPFTSFLRGRERLYWVRGKAGSGKSCLMKFLYQHERTKKVLSQWRPAQEPILLSFFIWVAGKPWQRSSKGLLSSLIYDLLQNDPLLLDHLFNNLIFKNTNVAQWSPSFMFKVLHDLVQRSHRPIFIFLDGLDEFDPDEGPSIIIEHVKSLERVLNLKLVVSSRPEPEFNMAFRAKLRIDLQRLTSDCIRKYAVDQLNAASSDDMYGPLQPGQLDRLVSTITEKANGVFYGSITR